jgi:hypothetical protein
MSIFRIDISQARQVTGKKEKKTLEAQLNPGEVGLQLSSLAEFMSNKKGPQSGPFVVLRLVNRLAHGHPAAQSETCKTSEDEQGKCRIKR